MTRFAHGVASGDPLTDRVVLWTRVVTEAPVRWAIARDPDLRDVVASGEVRARAEDDHTIHVEPAGLDAGCEYWYAFETEGARSPVARTRTLPDGGRVRFATCSCAKFNAGFFNAYSRIAEHEDLDFLLHLGDYIYEASNTPPASQTPGADVGRPFDPLHECRTLADYRTRYAQYRSDPDVQALHLRLPLIAALDDHELADGAWREGSTEHDPAEHGPWERRRDDALRARWEWLPARRPDPADPTRVFRTVRIGDLATIHVCDIRSRRDEPGPGARTMLGDEQRAWLEGELARHDAAWHLLATPSIFTRTWAADPQEPLRTALQKLKLMDPDGDGPDVDQWDGYPDERAALIERMPGDTIVLSADIHVSLASEVRDASDAAAAIEITAPSLTSQNLDDKLGVAADDPRIVDAERAYVDGHEHVHWCDMAGHGYVVMDITPQRARAEWWHVDTVLERTDRVTCAAAYEIPRGRTGLRAAGPALSA